VQAEVKANYPDSNIKLIEGGGGVFDVTCNGKMIYSKLYIEGDRFPKQGEITGLIEKEKG
jgi:selT/selW/selH-like putative selenoprotein